MNHELKVWPQFYDALERGLKLFEMRQEDDRKFEPEDTLTLQEFDPCPECNGSGVTNHHPCLCILSNSPKGKYTGRFMRRTVTYVMRGPVFGLKEGWVIMGLKA